MRNHHIHHLVVTHENEIVGVLSSFDLLQLVEDHRFAIKNPPTSSKRGGKKE
jgi:signal-transduction protein with cAMP-binding, CBS, and nucleotidyltransferase domain